MLVFENALDVRVREADFDGFIGIAFPKELDAWGGLGLEGHGGGECCDFDFEVLGVFEFGFDGSLWRTWLDVSSK